jgi:hypothetical protein
MAEGDFTGYKKINFVITVIKEEKRIAIIIQIISLRVKICINLIIKLARKNWAESQIGSVHINCLQY